MSTQTHTSSELKEKYPRLVYKNFSCQKINGDLVIEFQFKIEPDINFSPQVIVKNIPSDLDIDNPILRNLVFHLGLAEIPSYWKTTCSPEIVIESGGLSNEQIAWWHNLLINGMGQFFFENQIDFTPQNFVKITSCGNTNNSIQQKSNQENGKIMIPVGGGKDSAVTLQILSEEKKNVAAFLLNPTSAGLDIVKTAGVENVIIWQRTIDPELLKLNQQGFLNGHTPFSAYLAFLSILVAYIFNYDQIAFSNEKSSDEGNISYLGKEINHQYSKSFDFENKFRNYVRKYLSEKINYFSFLRPLYDLQISRLFSQYPQYFPVFRSCNVGQKKEIWCDNCSKCLFGFTSLYASVKTEELIKIFGQDLYENQELLPILEELAGEKRFKPFECVGTYDEVKTALYFSWKKLESEKLPIPYLLNYFVKNILPKLNNIDGMGQKLLSQWDNQNNLPSNLVEILKNKIEK